MAIYGIFALSYLGLIVVFFSTILQVTAYRSDPLQDFREVRSGKRKADALQQALAGKLPLLEEKERLIRDPSWLDGSPLSPVPGPSTGPAPPWARIDVRLAKIDEELKRTNSRIDAEARQEQLRQQRTRKIALATDIGLLVACVALGIAFSVAWGQFS